MQKSPVMLIILDGWGIREMQDGNAIKLGNTPNYDRWCKDYERAVLDASGEEVGLVEGQMGNSEVGHLNIGAGRVVYQDITRINIAIRENTLATRTPLANAIESAKSNDKKVHLVGLVSDGGVHSHINHLMAMLDITKNAGVQTVVHIITDGRDTPTTSGLGFVEQLEAYVNENDHVSISTLSGRYYAMDRDTRWERTKRAYDAITQRTSDKRASTASEALQASYEADVTDEFVEPVIIGDDESLVVESGDSIVCYNFRADRMRQLVQGLVIEEIDGFEKTNIADLNIVTFTEYIAGLPVNVLFDKVLLKNALAEILSANGKKQYHSAETEKYPHVTFFFNGRKEEPYEGEDRRIVPSPKVATYDLQPEMSAFELRDATLDRIKNNDDDFLLVNFANPDMVGHTGSLEAAMKAVEVVDECANALVEAVIAKGGVAIVTADHGNCDRMIEHTTGEAHTYHTVNPVPMFVMGDGYYRLVPRGKLADIAPTVLDLLGVDQPEEMTGKSMVELWTEEQYNEPIK